MNVSGLAVRQVTDISAFATVAAHFIPARQSRIPANPRPESAAGYAEAATISASAWAIPAETIPKPLRRLIQAGWPICAGARISVSRGSSPKTLR
ncbi:hypothetical protein [Stenotrophomonas maltophilia]|uniref:hypothetical protein n=1 Tax=Stenotrophomonas maltophilia TaxID=40324 RepID=UPI0021C16C14|nr:hypothetical protein [Stenotrophomonas maltophilia]UXL30998.1 hypothetical protein N0O74_09415 [Stenotrophomonas maltophilia]